MIHNNAWIAVTFALANAGQPLLTASLIDRRFDDRFKLNDVRQVLAFFVATAVAAASAAVRVAAALSLIEATSSPPSTARLWFAASSLGIITVAPLLIGLHEAMRERMSRELIEGWAGLASLRVRPGILCGVCEPYNSAQHKADHRQNDEGEMATREVFIVFGKAPAAAKPSIGAFNDPALR